jgi:hypothetical protein
MTGMNNQLLLVVFKCRAIRREKMLFDGHKNRISFDKTEFS